MSSSKGTNTYNRQNWEDSEFPLLCQTCLGDNPYLRMIRERYGKECKICTRPFTIFRWCPGAKMRYKKTEVCQTCAKLKNVCQTCLLDLEYGLPIQVRTVYTAKQRTIVLTVLQIIIPPHQVRDEILKVKDDIPRSDVNREYYLQQVSKTFLYWKGITLFISICATFFPQVDRELAQTDGTVAAGALGKIPTHKHEQLQRLARTTPYYKRNRWVRIGRYSQDEAEVLLMLTSLQAPHLLLLGQGRVQARRGVPVQARASLRPG